MQSFGDYVTIRQIAVEQTTLLFLAKKKDDPSNKHYVVKVFRPLKAFSVEGGPGMEELAELAKDLQLQFLQAVEIQRRAAEACRSIAPVHQSGNDDEGAWYVSDYYPRGFIRRYISQRALVTDQELRVVVSGIVQALLAMKEVAQRSHGNLKTSNILLGGEKGLSLRKTAIILTDPLSGTAAEAAVFEKADLRSIGELVYQLVTHKEIRSSDDLILPILPSEEWNNLGPHGDAWRELTSRLLDPHLPLQELNLETLAVEVRPRREVKKPLLMAGAAAGLITLAGLAVLLLMRQGGEREQKPDDLTGAEGGPPPVFKELPPVEVELGTTVLVPLEISDPDTPLHQIKVHSTKPNLAKPQQSPTNHFLEISAPKGGKPGQEHSVTITVNDGRKYDPNLSKPLQIRWIPFNHPPEVEDATLQVVEGIPTPIRIVARDREGELKEISVVKKPKGSLDDSQILRGEVLYRTTQVQPDEFTFVANDGRKKSREATVAIQVTPNQPPQITPPELVRVRKGESGRFQLKVVDPEGQRVQVQAVSAPDFGDLRQVDEAAFLFELRANTVGRKRMGFMAVDAYGKRSGPVEVEFDLFENRPPEITAIPRREILSNTSWKQELSARDPEGLPVSFAVVSQPAHGVVQLSGNVAEYTPHRNFKGSDSFLFAAYDNERVSSTSRVEIAVLNRPPRITGLPPEKIEYRVNPQSSLAFQVEDPDDILTPQHIVVQASDGAFLPRERLRWDVQGSAVTLMIQTPQSGGTTVVEVRVNDGFPGGMVTGSFRLEVRDIPPFTNSLGMPFEWVPGLPLASGEGGFVAKFEVTQREWLQVMGGENPSKEGLGNNKGIGDRFPVNGVSVEQAREFLQRFAEREKGTWHLQNGWRLSLPTSRQFLFVCGIERPDVPDHRKFLADQGLLEGEVLTISDEQRFQGIVEVGAVGKPNRFGLFNLVGNVSEWGEEGLLMGWAFDMMGRPSLLQKAAAVDGRMGFRCVLVPGNP